MLLNILRPRLMPNLPNGTKALIGTTSAKYKIEEIQDADGSVGKFVYLEIKENLINIINTELHINNEIINLQINIDEVPLFKSAAKQFWPILCRVDYKPMIYKPFPIAIYSGNSKPKLLTDFLQKFITEINELQTNGFDIDNKCYKIKIKCFICDTPARSFVKSTVNHTGFHSCERCTAIDEKVNRTTVISSIDSPE